MLARIAGQLAEAAGAGAEFGGAGAVELILAGEFLPAMQAAFVVRDNLRQRRAIERSYIHALEDARTRIDIVCPYFYPGRIFRRTLRSARKPERAHITSVSANTVSARSVVRCSGRRVACAADR